MFIVLQVLTMSIPDTTINILIIDDHQMVIDGIKLMLQEDQQLKWVAEANNGFEGLEILKNQTVDVVLLDMHMPQLNGLETCKKIKRLKGPPPKVLMLTMLEDPAIIKQMMQIGVDGYLLKNASHEELVTAIKAVAKGNKYFSERVKELLMNSMMPGHVNESTTSLPKLSKREKQVLNLIIEEHTTGEIAEKLFISSGTVETHRRNMLLKLDVRNTAGLVRMALEYNLLDR